MFFVVGVVDGGFIVGVILWGGGGAEGGGTGGGLGGVGGQTATN